MPISGSEVHPEKACKEQLGVHEPDFGMLFSDMILPDGARIDPRSVLRPRVEPEIAFVLKSDLVGEDLTAEQIIAATDYGALAKMVAAEAGSRFEADFGTFGSVSLRFDP